MGGGRFLATAPRRKRGEGGDDGGIGSTRLTGRDFWGTHLMSGEGDRGAEIGGTHLRGK